MVRMTESGPQPRSSKGKAVAFQLVFGFLRSCPARRSQANRYAKGQVFRCSVGASLGEANQDSACSG